MKYLYTFFGLMLATIVFSSCAGNKNLQENPPAQLQQAYVVSENNSLNLYIPVASIQDSRINLNSVYFRGMKADLQQDSERSGLYVAKFNTGRGDMIMSSDPKEEYRNKAPQPVEKSPVNIEDDEALLVFTENDDIKFYKITGIQERNQ